ncbi:MAG: hypothetical protein ABEK36_04405 [Candidatus Aenigmatarchaeota archaeon]
MGYKIYDMDTGSSLDLKASKIQFPLNFNVGENTVPGKFDLSEHDNAGFKSAKFTLNATYKGSSGTSTHLCQDIIPFFTNSGAKFLVGDYITETWRKETSAMSIQTPPGDSSQSGIYILPTDVRLENNPIKGYDSTLKIKGFVQGV